MPTPPLRLLLLLRLLVLLLLVVIRLCVVHCLQLLHAGDVDIESIPRALVVVVVRLIGAAAIRGRMADRDAWALLLVAVFIQKSTAASVPCAHRR